MMDKIFRAINKIRIDGFKETVDQGKYEISKNIWDPIARYVYLNYTLLERHELRSNAVVVSETESDYIMTKTEKDPDCRGTQFYYEPGDRFVSTVKNAKIVGKKGFVINQNDRIIVDCVAPPYILPRRPKISIRSTFRDMGLSSFYKELDNPTQKISTAAHLLPPFTNYYHWMVENLMKVRMLEKYGNKEGNYPDLLVPKQCPTWMQESIDMIEYDGNVRHWGNESAKIETLVVPSYPDPVKEECEWLKSRIIESKDVDPVIGNKIFIARQDASIRRIINFDEVSDTLNKYEFDIVIPSNYSVIEQAHIFNNADIIIGPHGAGLTNILFAENALILELWGDKLSTTFERLSKICGHNYMRLRCDTKWGNLHVDTSELENQIQHLMDQPKLDQSNRD